jgi:hypothetical protein
MTEADWRTASDPSKMLAAYKKYVRARHSARKLRLFACDCARRASPLVTYFECGPLIDRAEGLAEAGQPLEVAEIMPLHQLGRKYQAVIAAGAAGSLAEPEPFRAADGAGAATAMASLTRCQIDTFTPKHLASAVAGSWVDPATRERMVSSGSAPRTRRRRRPTRRST